MDESIITDDRQKNKGLNLQAKPFIISISVILALMITTFILTKIIPSGQYERIADENGNLIIDTQKGFSYTEGGISFGRWLLSPFLVLGANGNISLIGVILFLIFAGGSFNCLEKSGLMSYLVKKVSARFGNSRYRLLAILILVFMCFGSFAGSFEEIALVIPIVVSISLSLGWDAITGIGMSLLAAGCGFSAGVCNFYTVGVAQTLAGIPLMSGISFRLITFVLIFFLLYGFLRLYTKKIQKPLNFDELKNSFTEDKKFNKALLTFILVLGIGELIVVCSTFIPGLQSYSIIILLVLFLAAGLSSSIISGLKGKKLAYYFWKGTVSILPGILMILMSASIKFTLDDSKVIDTILFSIVKLADVFPKQFLILFIYAIVLVMNFFVGSASAKAFMLIPLLMPVAEIFGISKQLCILAFAFGDGFSNVLYPTNPVLLIGLSLGNTSYGKWVKFTWKFQLINLLLTSGILLVALAAGY